MRYKAYLRDRYRAVIGYIGQILMILGGLQAVPLLLLVFFPEEAGLAGAFLLTGAVLLIPGTFMWRFSLRAGAPHLTVQEGSVIIILVWLAAIFSSSLPLMLISDLTLHQAVFESTSAWTTTGLSVMHVEVTPNLVLFYRSLVQFVGAAGFAIVAVSAMSGGIGMGLALAEGRTDQLAPHMRQSASIVLRIYLGYCIFGILALKLAGMTWFDAVNHAFTALATGGFSTHSASIGYFDNPVIELVIIILMLLGAINFLIAYTFLRRKFRAVARNGEMRLGAVLLITASITLFVMVTSQVYPTWEKSLRVAIFESVSALTTTGFSTVDYRPWAQVGWMVLILLMLVGGATGSTAGAIKLQRVYILYKSVIWEIRRAFLPKHAVNEPVVHQGDREDLLSDRQVRQTALFVAMYMFVLFVGTIITAAHGFPLAESMFEFSSSLGNIGVTIGVTSPNLPPALLWTHSAGMLLGRLEFFAIIVGVLKIGGDLREILHLKRA
jgi:trk system potassium uptake protein TrkH